MLLGLLRLLGKQNAEHRAAALLALLLRSHHPDLLLWLTEQGLILLLDQLAPLQLLLLALVADNLERGRWLPVLSSVLLALFSADPTATAHNAAE